MFATAISFLVNFRKYLPWLVVAALMIGVHAFGSGLYKDWKQGIEKVAFEKGIQDERSRQDQIARKIEQALVPRLDAIDEKAGRDLAAQSTKETKYVERIIHEVQTNPDYSNCRVSGSVLDDRNAIRRSLDATLDPSGGQGSGGEAQGAS